ncbi:MAG: S41 family peptidase, partial [Planctomycetes bacterium]|nr:S41 family peptidase [Planctomycetota bacterium]
GAYTLHTIGDGVRRRAAQRFLRDALAGEPSPARAQSALALARCGQLEDATVILELEQLATGFGLQATLAESLIEQFEQQQRFRRKLAALDQVLEHKQPGAVKDGGDILLLEEVMRDIQMRHMEGERFSREELIAAAANGMLQRLDPHSNYLTGEEFNEFIFDMNPEYGGIGAYVNVVAGFFTITRPIYSGPAYEVGLRSGDRILEVEGWSTVDQPMDETIRRLKGKPGTEVTVLVHRRGWTEPRTMSIPRKRIDIASVFTEDLPGGILYIDLLNFTTDCGLSIVQAIEQARESGPLQGIVLDLRGNPGGYLGEAVDVCDVFLPAGNLVVTTKSRAGEPERYETMSPPAVPMDLPLTVLVDQYSASASEIVSGTLSIHGRATTIGERTFGKGSVQNLMRLQSLPDERWRDENRNGKVDDWESFSDRNGNGVHDFGPRMKLTMAYYYLPDGTTIHTLRGHDGEVLEEGGVEPDVAVEFPELDVQSLRELDRLIRESRFKNFAADFYADHPALAVKLAIFDGKKTEAYPGFSEFYVELSTSLEKDEVRRWMRRELRNVVADARGKVFAGSGFFGDFQEDPPLQVAIKRILEARGLSIDAIQEFGEVFSDS